MPTGRTEIELAAGDSWWDTFTNVGICAVALSLAIGVFYGAYREDRTKRDTESIEGVVLAVEIDSGEIGITLEGEGTQWFEGYNHRRTKAEIAIGQSYEIHYHPSNQKIFKIKPKHLMVRNAEP